MELWIRSQNKEILQRTNALFISHSAENIWSIIDNQNMTKYGKYTTRERALEVLDEIQKFLNPMLVFKNCNCNQEMLDNIKEAGACVVSDNTHIEQLQYCIYEIPEE